MMTDWKGKQDECTKCHGYGYTQSESRHADGRGQHAWASRCECQPKTLTEMNEAATMSLRDMTEVDFIEAHG